MSCSLKELWDACTSPDIAGERGRTNPRPVAFPDAEKSGKQHRNPEIDSSLLFQCERLQVYFQNTSREHPEVGHGEREK